MRYARVRRDCTTLSTPYITTTYVRTLARDEHEAAGHVDRAVREQPLPDALLLNHDDVARRAERVRELDLHHLAHLSRLDVGVGVGYGIGVVLIFIQP